MALVLMPLSSCTVKEGETGDNTENVPDTVNIGMSFDSFVIERWQRDRDVFVSTAKEMGAEVNVQNANGNISSYYFSKLFKQETGENYVEYLSRVRIENAKKMLTESEASIKEISYSVGFSDPNYFSRAFKKYEGVSPTEYKDAL